MKRSMLSAALAVAAMAGLSACTSSHDSAVKSDYRSQWTQVNQDVKTTTAAASAVLSEMDLRNVTSKATGVDGKAMGKKSDGTEVDVTIKRKSDMKSEVTVQIGTLGDPALGAEIAGKIKQRAEVGTSTKMMP